MFEHWYILAVIFFMMVNYGFRPSKKSLVTAVFYGNVVMLMGGVANAAWGTNYLFICEKPEGTTLIELMGPWPYYLIALELFAILIFALMYAPYFIYDHTVQPSKSTIVQA